MNRLDHYRLYLYGGLRVYYSYTTVQELSTVRLYSLGGHIYDKISGTAHFLEHMLFEGTKSFSKSFIQNDLVFLGCNDLNACTSHNYIAVYGSCFTNKLAKFLKLIYELINEPLLPAARIEKERQVILTEYLEHLNDIYSNLYFNSIEQIYPELEIDGNILGTVDTINKINIEDLIEYHTENCIIPNQVLVVRTCLSGYELNQLIAQVFPMVRSKPMTYHSMFPSFNVNVFQNNMIRIDTTDIHKGVGLLYSVPLKSSMRLPLQLLENILVSEQSDSLTDILRNQLGIIYGISSSINLYGMNSFFSLVTTFKHSNDIETVIEVIRNQFLQKVTEQQLDKVKMSMLIDTYVTINSCSGMIDSVLETSIFEDNVNFNKLYDKMKSVTVKIINSMLHLLANGNVYVLRNSNG